MLDFLISEFIKVNNGEIINLRRNFHKIPEGGFEEFKTSEMILNYLESLGLNAKRIASTGIVADINTEITDYCIALRFDIDALPITEDTGLSFGSMHSGMMHACGHDGHISIGLGIAKLLLELKEFIPARIRLIFQPAEEGLGGARKMIEEGALVEPMPDLIIGLHIWPYLQSGKIGIKSGAVMAAGDKFHIKLIGKGGHGSSPHLTIDPTVMLAEVIQGFQKIPSRYINPIEPVVISVGSIVGGNSFNTIPNDVEITGTTRFTNIELRDEIKNRMEDILESIITANGGVYEFVYEDCFDVTVSHEKLVNIVDSTAKTIIGEDNVVKIINPSMASEDFSEYEKSIPGLYFFLGTMNAEKDCIYPLHHSKFNIDEDILSIGVMLLGKLVYNISKLRMKEEFR
ncbi:M20 family metallopeptidase [Tissierella praeacuta]|uniref:M20 metallopeptidase family protein n=1 Tax=Tissierella praeacuta TaxID=43131 RepID=UPI002FD96D81